MYKILYLTQFSQIGGGETILLSLISKLNRKKFEPVVVLTENGPLKKRLRDLNVKTYILPLSPYFLRQFFVPGISPIGIIKTLNLIKKIKPDIIHLNHLTLAAYAGIPAKILKNLPAGRQVPVVATAHGPWDSYYFYQDILTHLFVDKIFAPTVEIKKLATKRNIVKTEKVKVVPFGIDTAKFKPATVSQKISARKKLGLPESAFVVTMVGRLDPVKDHLTFLKSASFVKGKIKNAYFLIAGSQYGDFSGQKSAYAEEIQGFLKENPVLAKNVTFTGFLKDILPVYHAADILVCSSASESFGLAIAEAASAGLPIVSTVKTPAIEDSKSGFFVPPKNLQLLSQKILYLHNNPPVCRQFGAFGRILIAKNYNLKDYVAKIEDEYLLALGKSPSAKS